MHEHMSAKDYRALHNLDLPEIGISPVKKPSKKKPQTTLNPLEHDIQTAILNKLAYQKNCFFWRQNSGVIPIEGRYFRAGFPGISDILGVYKGVFVAIEVKRPGEKLRPNQEEFLDHIKRAGGIAIVCKDDEHIISEIEARYKDIVHPIMVLKGDSIRYPKIITPDLIDS